MIYITGHKFIANTTPKAEPKVVSVQEKIALARRSLSQPKISSLFDTRFLVGNTYEISRIQKIVENNESKVKYMFRNIYNQLEDIDIVFPSVQDAENYIAALSGRIQELNGVRDSITALYETSTDI